MAQTLEELIAGLPAIVPNTNQAPQTEEDVEKMKQIFVGGLAQVEAQAFQNIANSLGAVLNAVHSPMPTIGQKLAALGTNAVAKVTVLRVLHALVKSQRPDLQIPPVLPVTHNYTELENGRMTATEK